MTIKINRDYQNADSRRPLLHRYPQQSQPQDAYLAIDEDGTVRVDWNAEIGTAVPVSVWNHRDLRVDVCPELTIKDIDALLEVVDPLVRKIHEGHSVVWDGNNNRGRLNEDAEDAFYELEQVCEEWEPSEWDYEIDGDPEEHWGG